jgi:hypothetical protein
LAISGAWPVPAFCLRHPRLRRRLLRLQNSRPVELNVRIVFLDEANRVFVERRTPDANAGRGSEPIQDARTRLSSTTAAGAMRIDDKRVLVAALVAAEPEVRQSYFLF